MTRRDHRLGVADILGWADIHPEREDLSAFVRRVRPLEHVEKLRAQTIHDLTLELEPVLETFGYSGRHESDQAKMHKQG